MGGEDKGGWQLKVESWVWPECTMNLYNTEIMIKTCIFIFKGESEKHLKCKIGFNHCYIY